MHFEKDQRELAGIPQRAATRGVVDALVVNERDLWVVVAPRGESIENWLRGGTGTEMAPLRLCRAIVGDDWVVLDDADPERDHLLSELEVPF